MLRYSVRPTLRNSSHKVLQGFVLVASASGGGYLLAVRQRQVDLLARARENVRQLQACPYYNTSRREAQIKSFLSRSGDEDLPLDGPISSGEESESTSDERNIRTPRLTDELIESKIKHSQHRLTESEVKHLHRIRPLPVRSRQPEQFLPAPQPYLPFDGLLRKLREIEHQVELLHRNTPLPPQTFEKLIEQLSRILDGTSNGAAFTFFSLIFNPYTSRDSYQLRAPRTRLYRKLARRGCCEELALIVKLVGMCGFDTSEETMSLLRLLRYRDSENAMVNVYTALGRHFPDQSIWVAPVIRKCLHLGQIYEAKSILESAMRRYNQSFPIAADLIIRVEWKQRRNFQKTMQTYGWLLSLIPAEDIRTRNRLHLTVMGICIVARNMDHLDPIINRLIPEPEVRATEPAQLALYQVRVIIDQAVKRKWTNVDAALAELDKLWQSLHLSKHDFTLFFTLISRQKRRMRTKESRLQMFQLATEYRSLAPDRSFVLEGIHSALSVSSAALSDWIDALARNCSLYLTKWHLKSIFRTFENTRLTNWNPVCRAVSTIMSCDDRVVPVDLKYQTVDYFQTLVYKRKPKLDNRGLSVLVETLLPSQSQGRSTDSRTILLDNMRLHILWERPDEALSEFWQALKSGALASTNCYKLAIVARWQMSDLGIVHRDISGVDSIIQHAERRKLDVTPLQHHSDMAARKWRLRQGQPHFHQDL